MRAAKLAVLVGSPQPLPQRGCILSGEPSNLALVLKDLVVNIRLMIAIVRESGLNFRGCEAKGFGNIAGRVASPMQRCDIVDRDTVATNDRSTTKYGRVAHDAYAKVFSHATLSHDSRILQALPSGAIGSQYGRGGPNGFVSQKITLDAGGDGVKSGNNPSAVMTGGRARTEIVRAGIPPPLVPG